MVNVDGLVSAVETNTLRYMTIDLNVGRDFEKLKGRIQGKFQNANVGNY